MSLAEIISWIANIASIVSLAVSLYVAWQVRSIKRRFVRRFATRAFIEQLRSHTLVLSKFIGTTIFDDILLRAELARCEANLNSALSHLEGKAHQEAKGVLASLTATTATPDLSDIYVKMIRLQQGLENVAAEQEARSNVE